MSKEQTPITAEDFLETSIPPQEIITASDDFCYTPIEVSWHMEQYAELRIQQEREKWKEETKKKVLEALEREFKELENNHPNKGHIEYYETEVEPKYNV